MIALTARYVFPTPQLRVALWPLLLVALFLLPFALLAAPIALLVPRKGKSELIERVKRGEITLTEALRQLEAQR